MGQLAIEGFKGKITSTGDLNAKTFVGFDGAVEETNSNVPYGVTTVDSKSGDVIAPQTNGHAVIIAGEAISTVGNEICAGTSGYAYLVASSEKVAGYNVTTADAGEDMLILIDRGQ